MSEKQFEDFLVEQLVKWGSKDLKPGFRYQFKSPDNKNSESLLSALLRQQAGKIQDGATELPFVELNGVKLICVLHGNSLYGYTENYISRLRDKVSSQQYDFPIHKNSNPHQVMLCKGY